MENDLLDDKKLRAAFDQFDLDGNGVISEDELKAVFTNYGGGEVDQAYIDVILKQVDIDGDGTIDFEEFETMMLLSSAKPSCEDMDTWHASRAMMSMMWNVGDLSLANLGGSYNEDSESDGQEFGYEPKKEEKQGDALDLLDFEPEEDEGEVAGEARVSKKKETEDDALDLLGFEPEEEESEAVVEATASTEATVDKTVADSSSAKKDSASSGYSAIRKLRRSQWSKTRRDDELRTVSVHDRVSKFSERSEDKPSVCRNRWTINRRKDELKRVSVHERCSIFDKGNEGNISNKTCSTSGETEEGSCSSFCLDESLSSGGKAESPCDEIPAAPKIHNPVQQSVSAVSGTSVRARRSIFEAKSS